MDSMETPEDIYKGLEDMGYVLSAPEDKPDALDILDNPSKHTEYNQYMLWCAINGVEPGSSAWDEVWTEYLEETNNTKENGEGDGLAHTIAGIARQRGK